MTTELYRIESILTVQGSALDRIAMQAREGGSLTEILRECEQATELVLAIGRCESDDELTKLLDR